MEGWKIHLNVLSKEVKQQQGKGDWVFLSFHVRFSEWMVGWVFLYELSGSGFESSCMGGLVTFLYNPPSFSSSVKKYFSCCQLNFLSICVLAIASILFSNYYEFFNNVYYYQCLFLENNIQTCYQPCSKVKHCLAISIKIFQT